MKQLFHLQNLDHSKDKRTTLKPTQHKQRNKLLAFCQGLMMASAPIDILWAIICLMEVGVIATITLLSLFGIAAAIVGVLVGVHHFKKLEKDNKKRCEEKSKLEKELIELDECVNHQQAMKLKKLQQTIELFRHLGNLLGVEREIEDIVASWELESSDNLRGYRLFTQNPMLRQQVLMQLCTVFKAHGHRFDYEQNHGSFSLELSGSEHEQKTEQSKTFFPALYKSRMSRTVIEGLGLASILFVSFFWCSTYLVTALGLAAAAAALSSPIGIAVALAVSLTLGIIYAKSYFAKLTVAHEEKEEIKQLKTESQHKYKMYHDHKSEVKALSLLNEKINRAVELHECMARKELLQESRKLPDLYLRQQQPYDKINTQVNKVANDNEDVHKYAEAKFLMKT